MQNYTISQEYLLCALNDEGKFPAFNKHAPACFVSSCIVELMIHGCVEISKEAVITVTDKKISKSHGHLKSLHDVLCEKSPISVSELAKEYVLHFKDEKYNELLKGVGNSLVKMSSAEAPDTTLSNRGIVFKPNRIATEFVLDYLRSDLLMLDVFTKNSSALLMLLKDADMLKTYFAKIEMDSLEKTVDSMISAVIETEFSKIIKIVKILDEEIMKIATI